MSISEPSDAAACDAGVESSDVCIVGAGLAGINALFVASRYLSRNQRIIPVDSRERVGGIWVDTYSYVRLHQPHRMFTAGNIKWALGRDRSYLATKGEVLNHFDHCLNVVRQRVQVDEFFGFVFESYEEVRGKVRITCRSSCGSRPLVIESKRLIQAYGFRAAPNDALKLSSAGVQSVSPDLCDMRGSEMRASDAPVWIIGGGKTAIDTAHALITEYPGREVNLVAGSGTFFLRRDQLFPSGVRRWWGGTRASSILRESARYFDGTNEIDVEKWLRATYGVSVTPEADNFLLGFLSESERKTVAAGIHEIVMDYLVDIVDYDDVTTLVFRSGFRKAIKSGSWIVNCTGYLWRRDHEHPYQPYASQSGAVISIQTRSATMHLTSVAAYFLTHLQFLGQLGNVPLYELDSLDLRRKSVTAFPYTFFTLAQYNLGHIADVLSAKEILGCGSDFDRWYPLPHRLLGAVQFMRTRRSEREHQRRTLDVVRERFGVRCNLLVEN